MSSLKLPLFALILPLMLQAQELPDKTYLYRDQNKEQIDAKKLLQNEEVFLRDQALVEGENNSLGYQEDKHFTQEDGVAVSANLLVNSNPKKIDKLLSYEFHLHYYWHPIWLVSFASLTQTRFGEITDNATEDRSNNADAEENFIRNEDDIQDLLTFGVGLAYRFRFLVHYLNLQDWFEMTAIYLTYHSMDESFRALNYTGPGLRTDFGVHKRFSRRWHWGIKLSYNLAMVTRDKLNDFDEREDRTFVLSWLSMGLDLTMYF